MESQVTPGASHPARARVIVPRSWMPPAARSTLRMRVSRNPWAHAPIEYLPGATFVISNAPADVGTGPDERRMVIPWNQSYLRRNRTHGEIDHSPADSGASKL